MNNPEDLTVELHAAAFIMAAALAAELTDVAAKAKVIGNSAGLKIVACMTAACTLDVSHRNKDLTSEEARAMLHRILDLTIDTMESAQADMKKELN